MKEIEIDQPDDWHVHLRDGELLRQVAPATARVFGRAVVMPNLSPPVTTVDAALEYRERILAVLPEDSGFDPLMTLYLTEGMTVETVSRIAETPEVVAVKLYPKGATTNSEAGVEGLDALSDVLSALERYRVPLLVHGESTAPECDVFDRERVFLDQTLQPLTERHPEMRIVFEHITTAEAAQFVAAASDRVAATLTPQHLLLNRNALFDGGLRPHHYCLPVLKRERDRQALVAAATSGHPSFFLGTDSAPHERSRKEASCGCAGIYSAPVALDVYAEVFAEASALDKLEGFASHHGPDFYGLPRNSRRVRLEWVDPAASPSPNRNESGKGLLEVFCSGRQLRYRARQASRPA